MWRGDLWSFSGVPYARAPVGALALASAAAARSHGTRCGTRRRSGRSRRSRPPCRDHQPVGSRRIGTAERGLPLPQRLDAGPARDPDAKLGAAAGPGLHPRRRLHVGQRLGVPLPRRQPRPQRRRRRGHHQLPPGCARLPRTPRPRRSGRPGRQLGHPGPGGRAGVGARATSSAFGGDPANVTIFGESAGGFSVAALLGCPAARACSAAPSCRAVACTCTPSRRRSGRPSAWPPCWGSRRVTARRSSGFRRPSSSPPPRRSASGGPTRA